MKLRQHKAIAVMLSPDRYRLDERVALDQVSRLVKKFGAAHYVLNFEYVETLYAGELGSLVAANNELQKIGGRISLVNVSPLVFEILQITCLDRMFGVQVAEPQLQLLENVA